MARIRVVLTELSGLLGYQNLEPVQTSAVQHWNLSDFMLFCKIQLKIQLNFPLRHQFLLSFFGTETRETNVLVESSEDLGRLYQQRLGL